MDILTDIKTRLLQSEAGKYIIKIIVFGSYVRGESNIDSDIDLLIVKRNDKIAEEIINKNLYNIGIDTGAPIEALICHVEEILWPDNYFIYNILSYGKEIFSVDKETLKKEAQRGLIELAKEYLKAGVDSANSGHLRLAVDACYNAAELAAKSLLIEKMDDLPGSHGGLVNKFGELYIKTKELPEELGRGLNNALQLRNWARYKWEIKISKDDCDKIYSLAKKLIEIAIGEKH